VIPSLEQDNRESFRLDCDHISRDCSHNYFLSRQGRRRSDKAPMAIPALELMTKFSSRFAYEILPVAVASVIGAMLVNHYNRQQPWPPIVIQAPSASEDAMVQSLREEHELIATFMKRYQDNASDAERSGSDVIQAASVAQPSLSLVDLPLPEPRPAAQKTIVRLAPKPTARKKSPPTETPAPQPDPPAIALEAAPPSPPSLAHIEFEPAARPIMRVAGEVRDWVADVAQASERAAFLPGIPDWSSMPPLVRTLNLFRQN
jgi:hypothetical protein